MKTQAKSRQPKTETLIESVGQSIATSAIDTEAGIIRGVKVLGRESSNGRLYSDRALEDASKLYENAQVNIDHDRKDPHRERGLLEGFGVLRSPVIRNDGVYADLHYLRSHPATAVFLEHAMRFPLHFGLSHNADGTTKTKSGKVIVESIERVNSVDIVRNPATNRGLFESQETPMRKTIRQLLESSGNHQAAKCGLLEMDGMGEMEVEIPEGMGSEDGIWAAFKQAIMSIVDDDSLDTKAMLKKIGGVLKAYDGLSDQPAAPQEPAAEASDPPADTMEESKIVKALNEQVSTLVESVKTLTSQMDEMRAMSSRKPKPLMESRFQASPVGEYPKSLSDFVAAAKG